MVRVPGSSGDSGFHRESTEDVKIKEEPGIKTSAEDGSSPTLLKTEEGSTDRQSFGRSSDDVKEEGSAMDLEEKPHPPPQVPSGTPADRDANRGPPDEGPTGKTDGPSPKTTPPASQPTSKKKSKTARKKLKAPESEAEDAESRRVWTEEELASAFYRKDLYRFLAENQVMKIMQPKLIGTLQGSVKAPKDSSSLLEAVQVLMRMLEEAGIVLGPFDADELFDVEIVKIREATLDLFTKLAPLIGSVVPLDQSGPRSARSQTGSSQYASATSDAGSDSSAAMPRMTLGPAGAEMLREYRERSASKLPAADTSPNPAPNPVAYQEPAAVPRQSQPSPDRLQTFFNAAMERFLKEQQAAAMPPTATTSATPSAQTTTPVVEQPKAPETQDVDMESVGSRYHASEYDPDDLDVVAPRRAAVASAEVASGGTLSAARIRVSAISELKEFSGKDNDEDRARNWLSKVQSAFIRDQAPDSEKCLVFGDLLSGPARNWYRQLSRTTRSEWKTVAKLFQTQYCGRGVSVARQYYHARKRPDESPLEYLHRLNVAGLRAQLAIKDGSAEARREHIDHFIETLDDRDLANQLALLMIPDADKLEEILRARQRAKARQGKSVYGSIKPKPKAPCGAAPSAAARAVRAIRTTSNSSDSELDPSGSEGEGDLRKIYSTAATDQPTRSTPAHNQRRPPRESNNRRPDHSTGSGGEESQRKPCSHCGSTKHTDLRCWRRLTCGKCGKKGHPTDRCLFVCKACGEIHEAGECPMEEFYNLIRQWYKPSQHAGLFPPETEKM